MQLIWQLCKLQRCGGWKCEGRRKCWLLSLQFTHIRVYGAFEWQGLRGYHVSLNLHPHETNHPRPLIFSLSKTSCPNNFSCQNK